MDEDIYKLLDVKALHKIGILGCSTCEVRHLSRHSEPDVNSTFAAYVSGGLREETEYSLTFADHD